MFPKDIVLLPHEIEHIQKLESIASECTLFLKRDNNAFPINAPCEVALFGNGARHTLKGGTGSGDVNSHFFNNIETELELAGFTVTSKKWLDEYDALKKHKHELFIQRIKREAKQHRIGAPQYSVGKIDIEVEYDLDITGYKGDICIYVLSRNSGEASDRKLEKGDVYLTDKEVKDILYLNKTYDKFMLVINNCGMVELTPVFEVENIYLLSELGTVTSAILVDVILGKTNPSGKLSDTWAKIEDYPYMNEFGDRDNTCYLEGVYVGYRYFNSKGIRPVFPFGFGKSYSEFDYKFSEPKLNNDSFSVKVNVLNKSDYAGKEVIQLYLSSKGKINTPKNELAAFKKTSEIPAKGKEDLTLEFKLSDFAIYDEKRHSYLLQKGFYVIRGGNSSIDLVDIAKIKVEEDIVIKEVKNVFAKPDFDDLTLNIEERIPDINVPLFILDSSAFSIKKVEYCDKYRVNIPNFIKNLSIDELILLNIGDYKTGLSGAIGQSGSLVPGAAGETTLRIPTLPNSLCMADGPAGLRLISEYKVNHKGHFALSEDSIWRGVKEFVPSFFANLLDVKKNHKKKGTTIYQYCTALPIATAVAQSFNANLAYEIGRLVNAEMKLFDVDIWLAPAMNIHRNILCGRNFEYYSEDPLLSSVIASNVIKGVEVGGKIATIKHFACNNQEHNRFNSNSILSERALREIYLRGFEKAIHDSNPSCVMVSYNLINGVHASESKELLFTILRDEWNYKGLVMTDWIASGHMDDKSSVHPAATASKCLTSGSNLCMPGNKKDIKDIKKALKEGKINKEDLQINASIVYSLIVGEKNI